jgi:hypothetical protein
MIHLYSQTKPRKFMADLFDNSAAARAASLFSRGETDDEDDVTGIYSMSFRLPVPMAATIAVMAEHAGQSRNEMAQLIIRAGIDAIYRETPMLIQEELNSDIGEKIQSFL